MKVTVLGSGIMGNGIAQLAAMAGDEAVAYDVATEPLDRAAATIDTSLARFVKSERLTREQADAARARLHFTTDLPQAVTDADTVVEAIPEVLDLKQRVWGEVVAHAPEHALLGTNTSQLSITSIASALGEHAHRLVGLHFFNPPVMMRLVEVIAGLETTDAVLRRAREFGEHLGREVVVCHKDSPGFITSRAYAILRLECMRMIDEGVASAADIDKAMRLGFNFPMGPLELGDMNGLDTFMHAVSGLAEAHGERFRPTVGLRNMVSANRLGRKSGAGYYRYDTNGTRIPEQ